MDFNPLFQNLQKLVGQWGGDDWDIMRPDYAQVDNTPSLILSGQRYRCDPTGPRFAEPNFSGSHFYDIFGDRSPLLPGDILMPSVADGNRVPITILNYFPTKAMTGIRTDKLGDIIKEEDGTVLYKNVYFEIMGISFPGIPLNSNFEETLRIPNTKATIFNRPNIIQTRCHLIQHDYTVTVVDANGKTVPFTKRWLIDLIDYSGNHMILTLKNI